MIKYILIGSMLCGFLGIVSSCGDSPSSVNQQSMESYTAGEIAIAVDESFKPLMTQQVNVFDSSYPNAKLNVSYLPENECLASLFEGKTKMIFTTRGLSAEEKKGGEANNIYTKELAVAKDGIVILVNNKSEDVKMTVGMVQSILTGKFARKYNVVLDNKNGSIARYINDSILRGEKISEQVFAANNSDEVIKYVSENENAIGFVGMTHAFDPESNVGYGTFRKDIKVVSIKNDSLDKFILPYQASIALGDYPFVRRLYFISRIESNLASGFANFITSTPGQKLIDKARMVPLATQLYIQEVEIKP